MLYNLLAPLADQVKLFNLFRYITFRTGGAILTALVISLLIGPAVIRWLKRHQNLDNTVREDVPETHLKKKGTPTMGGLMILLTLSISTLLWSDLTNPHVWTVLLVTLLTGMIGFLDDWLKLTRNRKGLPGRLKLLGQIVIAAFGVIAFMMSSDNPQVTDLAVPFFKNFMIPLGFLFLPFAIFVIVGASNAVNLTDGLDGLAIGPVMFAAGAFGIIAYLTGNAKFAEYLQIPHVQAAGELAIYCGALLGASLGFLWFNAPPAMVFMGDTGSLAMGSGLGILAVITKHELVLAIIGGLFVLEAVSVIVQVTSFKLTGKRVFRMAPLHHHFEKKGWAEPTIVIRFWIIAIVLALLGLSTLKLR